jgi:membrane dipeptidase
MNRRTLVKGAAAFGVASSALNASQTVMATSGRSTRLIVDGLEASEVKEGFLKLARTGGVHCVHKTVFGADSYAALHGFVEAHSGQAVIVGSVREIRQAQQDGKIAFVCGAQAAGGPYGNGLEEAMYGAPLGSLSLLPSRIQALKGLGLRIQGLCYNTFNVFGSGCLNHAVGLSRAGQRLVEEIHNHRLLLDVGGHTGEQTSLDAIAASPGVPIVCTHTNFAALNPNMRCISDRLASAIAETGGVIGLTAISDFLVRNPDSPQLHGSRSPLATLDVLLDQFDHGKRLVGADHLGLGPDFVWGQQPVEIQPEDTVMFPAHSLSRGVIRTCEGFEDISQLPNLIRGLESRGWTQDELDAVLGGNWLRVYEQVWGT